MSYENFVMRTMRSQKTARTHAEAYRTPEYACAIYRFQSDNERGAKALADIFLHFVMLLVMFVALYSFYLWLS
jgi:hypothetical protein